MGEGPDGSRRPGLLVLSFSTAPYHPQPYRETTHHMLMHAYDSQLQRIRSASAVFQKGIYHLFSLSTETKSDAYALLLRKYQALFQLCLTHLLLDFDTAVKPKKVNARLKPRCADPRNPTAAELDVAVTITHSVFEAPNGWPGAALTSVLHISSRTALALHHRTVDARHDLVYRPMLLGDNHWEDCPLETFLRGAPGVDEIHAAYDEFVGAILRRQDAEIAERKWVLENIRGLGNPPAFDPDDIHAWADYFITLQFLPYEDRLKDRPTETVALSYGRLLGRTDQELRALCTFRNELLRFRQISDRLYYDPHWNLQLGDV